MRFLYPAVFTKEDSCYLVSFPDFDGYGTYGDDLTEAYEMAKELMEAVVSGSYVGNAGAVPAPTDPMAIQADKYSFISLVYSDFDPIACYTKGKKSAALDEREDDGAED